MERIVTRVHYLPRRNHVEDRLDTQPQNEDCKPGQHGLMNAGWGLQLRRSEPKHSMENPVVECRNRKHNREDVQPGEISTCEDHALKNDGHYCGHRRYWLRKEVTKRCYEFGEMVEPDTRTMSP